MKRNLKKKDILKFKPVRDELEKLKLPGYDIINLLNDLNKDDLTISKMQFTVENAFSKLKAAENENSLTMQTVKKFFIMRQLEYIDDETLLTMLANESKTPKDEILKHYKSSSKDIPYRHYLIVVLTDYMYNAN